MAKAGKNNTRKRQVVHQLRAADLTVSSPEIGGKPPPIPKSAHRLRHSWQGRNGRPAAFTPEREQELRGLLEARWREHPEEEIAAAERFVIGKMTYDERDGIRPSTIRAKVVRPVRRIIRQ